MQVLQFIESHTDAELSSCSGPLAGPNLKAPIHLLLLISGYCSSFACFLTSLLHTELLPWLARRNISACLQNRDPHTGSNVVVLFPPLQTTQLKCRRVFFCFRKAVAIYAHTVSPNCFKKRKRKKKRTQRSGGKKTTLDYHKRDKNVSFKMSELW